MNSVRQISFLWLGSMGGAAFAFFIQLVLARSLSSDEFGLFSSVMNMVMVVVPIAGFGVAQFWLKAFGEEGWLATRWFPASFKFTLITSMGALLMLIFWAIGGPHDSITRNLIICLSFYVLGQIAIELVSSKYQLEEEYIKLAWWQLLPHMVRFFLLASFLIFLGLDLSVIEIGYMYSCVAVFFFIIGMRILFAMYHGRFLLSGHGIRPAVKSKEVDFPKVGEVLTSAWPFGLAAFSNLIYYQSDIVLVKYYAGDASAGTYSVSFTVMAAFYLLPGVIYQKYLLPKMHRWANLRVEKLYEIYRVGNYIMLALGMLLSITLWVISGDLIGLLFGERYEESARILKVLAFSAPIIFMAFSTGATLVTRENMRLKVTYMLMVAGLNVVLNILFIPEYGAIGAAYTTLVSNAALLLLYYRGAQKHVFGRGFFDLRKN